MLQIIHLLHVYSFILQCHRSIQNQFNSSQRRYSYGDTRKGKIVHWYKGLLKDDWQIFLCTVASKFTLIVPCTPLNAIHTLFTLASRRTLSSPRTPFFLPMSCDVCLWIALKWKKHCQHKFVLLKRIIFSIYLDLQNNR